jgi:cell division protein FtsB
MSRAAVAETSSAPGGEAIGAEGAAPTPKRRRPGLRLRRTQLWLLVLLVVSAWVVFAFGRTLTQINQSADRLSAARAESAALSGRLEQLQAELELVQTDAFLRLQARGYGMGRANERPFALQPDAPSPEPIVALGGGDGSGAARTPLESWLHLLIGD